MRTTPELATPSPNYHTTPTIGRLNSRQIESASLPYTGRSYHRISSINDTGSSSYRDPNMYNYSPTNRVLIPKKGSRRSFDTEPSFRISYASDH
ncbi:hypothetical protein TNCV_2828771 [Trichonephila clavipes]|nr:hypothetical protein TNCV_2828771 [Trichonephila clavipes]